MKRRSTVGSGRRLRWRFIVSELTTAENGQKALELLGQGEDNHTIINHQGLKINLVVTDYCMPGMTGYDLLKKVKESCDMKEIPVIIVSSENVPTRIEK
ncbi:hypothetical protein E3N88_11199 [Mikania micrantha]|uniref:Response regulatory domain-containing protein n=1 Tax=Mikania micrantha TaxID=192012 RepID=A0A5N6PDT8_9ASTR|nr:hypothetical protein E3N88_11199 [Mikania micrantha]